MRARTLAAVLGVMFGAHAHGHAKGFHKRTVATVNATGMELLVTLDLDGSQRALLLRQGADRDGNGALSPAERRQLEATLSAMATKPLKVQISGYPLQLEQVETKLNLRKDGTVSESGLSSAVLLRATFPESASEGLELVLQDRSPDDSHVAVEVFQLAAPDAGIHEPIRADVRSGKTVKVRLGRMAAEPVK
jgi:hypothetical protein